MILFFPKMVYLQLSMIDDVDTTSAIPRQRKSSATTIFLFLSALAVMCMGILGGIAIYRLYVPSQAERMRFHGYCGVPYDSQAVNDAEMLRVNNNLRTGANNYPLGLEDFNMYRWVMRSVKM